MDFHFFYLDLPLIGGWLIIPFVILTWVLWIIYHVVTDTDTELASVGILLGAGWGLITIIATLAHENDMGLIWIQYVPLLILFVCAVVSTVIYLFRGKFLTWDLVLYSLPILLSFGLFFVT